MSESLWLEFPTLQPVVDELAAEVGNPSFVPHMTVIGNLPSFEDKELQDVVKRLHPPDAVPLPQFGTRHEDSRFLVLVAEPTRRLMDMFTAVYAALPSVRHEHFGGWPHVSLLYGTETARKRWPDPFGAGKRFGERLFTDYAPAAFSSWDTSGDVGSWHRLDIWPLAGG